MITLLLLLPSLLAQEFVDIDGGSIKVQGLVDQIINIPFSESENIYQVQLFKDDSLQPNIQLFRDKNGQTLIRPNVTGCYSVQTKLETTTMVNIPIKNILSAAIMGQYVGIVTPTQVTMFLLNYPTHDDSKEIPLTKARSFRIHTTVKLNVTLSKAFAAASKDTFYIIGKEGSFFSKDLVKWKSFKLANFEDFKDCVFIKGFFACHTKQKIVVYKVSDNSLVQTIDHQFLKQGSIQIEKLVAYDDKTISSIFVVDYLNGIHKLQLLADDTLGWSEMVYSGSAVKSFGINEWGYVILNHHGYFDFIYAGPYRKPEINRINTGMFNDVFYNEDLQIMVTDTVQKIYIPNQLGTFSDLAETFLYHPGATTFLYYNVWGYLPYLISVSEDQIQVHTMYEHEGYVTCQLNSRQQLEYTAEVISTDCYKKRSTTGSADQKLLCRMQYSINGKIQSYRKVESLNAYATSSNATLAVALGLGIPIIAILMLAFAFFIRNQQIKELRELEEYRDRLKKQKSEADPSSDQIIKVE